MANNIILRVQTIDGNTGIVKPDSHAYVYLRTPDNKNNRDQYTDAAGNVTLQSSSNDLTGVKIGVRRELSPNVHEPESTAQVFVNITPEWFNRITTLDRTTPPTTTNPPAKPDASKSGNNSIIAIIDVAIGILAAIATNK